MNSTRKMIKILLFSLLLLACGTSKNSVTFKKNSSETGIYEFEVTGKGHKVLDNDSVMYTLKSTPSIAIEKFESLYISKQCYTNEVCVSFQLNTQGTEALAELTKRNLNHRLFFVIDGVIISDPFVMGTLDYGIGEFPIKAVYFDSLFVVK